MALAFFNCQRHIYICNLSLNCTWTKYNYLNALESAFIIQRIPRYDIKGKEILQTNEKYYIGDQSLKYAVMGYKDRAISGILENIVMLELMRKGYQVYDGKFSSNGKLLDSILQ